MLRPPTSSKVIDSSAWKAASRRHFDLNLGLFRNHAKFRLAPHHPISDAGRRVAKGRIHNRIPPKRSPVGDEAFGKVLDQTVGGADVDRRHQRQAFELRDGADGLDFDRLIDLRLGGRTQKTVEADEAAAAILLVLVADTRGNWISGCFGADQYDFIEPKLVLVHHGGVDVDEAPAGEARDLGFRAVDPQFNVHADFRSRLANNDLHPSGL